MSERPPDINPIAAGLSRETDELCARMPLELTVRLSPDDMDVIVQRVADEIERRGLVASPQANGTKWLTLEQAAGRLGCSPDAVRMRVSRGRLESRHQGRRVYVSAESVDRLG